MTSTVAYPHIETRSDGVAFVTGTQIKVVEIALDHMAHHWTAEDIQHQYPELKLAQIHSALACYFDHQAEFDAEIDRQLAQERMLLASVTNPSLQARLTAARKTR